MTRHIPAARPRARIVAVILTLFGGLTPVILLAPLIPPGLRPGRVLLSANDLVPSAALWGYAPMAIAVGLMPFVVDGASRALAGRASRRDQIRTAVLALLVAWAHPWQGETLFVICGGLVACWAYELWNARRRGAADGPAGATTQWPLLRSTLLIACAAVIPILYYLVLGRVDPGWAAAQRNNDFLLDKQLIFTAVGPLVAIALAAGWRIRHDPAIRGLLLWPLATLLVVAATPSGQNRALAGLTLPVVVLVVRAWPASIRRPRPMAATVAALAFAVVPIAVFVADTVQNLTNPVMPIIAAPSRSDVRAAQIAARASHGLPIVAAAQLGATIPAVADAPSWLGQSIWTPDYQGRVLRTALIFLASPTPATERAALRGLKTRALVQPCGFGRPVDHALAPLGFHAQRVGCASVYVRNAT